MKILPATLLLTAALTATAANPYLPLWEHIPDGEPYVFDDPDCPGRQRVYIYGSHDMLHDQYCGTDQVVWSAPVDTLDAWRYDGVIFRSVTDRDGRPLRRSGKGDVLYAPDVAMRIEDGTPMYYLYPNNQADGRRSMVARSRRPDGPFEVINWSKDDAQATVGVLDFDPAVFVDDDGRVYGYWGFGKSCAAQLDPVTMATVAPGCEIISPLISGYQEPGVFRFFEASSMRKIGDKYVLVFSRVSEKGEWGMPPVNYTLAYAYSDSPLGPFTYGGTLIDCRGRDTDSRGNPIATATPAGNTHGSLCLIGGKWWLFFHRQTGRDEFSRQAMVAPVSVTVEPGPGGRVDISEAEYTSEGFETDGLDPLRRYPAAIASHFTGPRPARQVKYPVMNYTGPYFHPIHITDHTTAAAYSPVINFNPVVNTTSGSTLGYKYYNFDKTAGADSVTLLLECIPTGVPGKIEVYTSVPWRGEPTPVGSITLPEQDTTASGHAVTLATDVSPVGSLRGKHPLYLTFSSPVEGASVATLLHLQFATGNNRR